jgi:hypothetical protein
VCHAGVEYLKKCSKGSVTLLHQWLGCEFNNILQGVAQIIAAKQPF